MFIINDDKSIEITRGDTAYVAVSITNYTFKVGDIIKMGVKKSANDDMYIFEKQITIDKEKDKAFIKIEPEDTKNAEFGKYVYDVQLTQNTTGDISTFIPINKFIIGKEVS